jgi:RHS repeat-associated protein
VPFGQIDTYEQFNGGDMDGSTTLYTPYGLANISEVWDFGTSSSRGPLLRREVWTYGYSIPNLVTEDEVFDGGGNLAGETVYNYDITTPVTSAGVPQHIPVSGPRGNLTGKSIFASSGTYYNLTAAYEDTGSVLTSTTPAGMTSLTYDSTFVYNTGATLPTPSSGVAIGVSQTFDTAYTGLPLISTDPNSQQTKIPATEYDPMLRPIEIEYPDGGQINWAYTPTTMTTTTIQTPNPTATSEVQLDGYGRLSRTEVANGQSGNDYYQQDTCYDANGNPAFSSYAYQGTGFGATKGCTVLGSTVTNTVNGDIYYYDVLGRVTQIVRQNGETRTYTYNGRDVESIDENGVTRIVQVDGLGRYSVNCEISSTALQGVSPVSCGTDIPGTGFLTTYSYVPAPGTTIITQGAQTRTFQSDWLGRPTLVQEPESGTTTYSYAYNSTGLVVTRTRPMANQTSTTVTTTTTTQYDALNRVLSISYSDGTPMKTFAYDKAAGVSTGTGAPFTDLTQANLIGRLSMASVPLAETAYSYDPLGRANYLDSCLPSGPCGTVAYNRQEHFVYDLAGNPVSSTDGAGTTSTYTVSPASELLTLTSSISNSTNPANIVSSVQNGPNGPISYSLGNGLSSVYGYDTLGRLNGGWVCNGSTAASCTGGTQVYGFTNGWKGVQLQSSYDSVLGQTSTYGYDGFNRLGSRTVTSGTGPNYGWVYDRYGNRWQQNITGGTGSGPTISVSFNSANNQISTSGYTYDAAGNMTDDGFNSYTYDGENNITQVGSSTASYVYNALNQRVRAVVGSTTTEFVFNAAGQRVSTWNGTTHAQLLGKYYWGSQPAAFYTTVANSAGAAAHFEHQDWLGTERMRTTYNGGVEGEFTSLPFGDGQTTISGSDLDPNHYALLDYDAETETDHAQFRQYSSAQGHWMSPDPYMGSYDFGNPQSFNRYVYALNNPLSIIDPEGLYCQWDDGSIDDDPSDGGDTYDQCIADGGTWLVLADSTTITVNGGNLNDPGITVENGNKIDPSNGKPPLTPQQKQCVANAQADHSTAVSRAWSDANTTWGQDVVIGTGGGAVGGCVGGAIFGGVGCIPGGLIGGLGGFAGSVPFGLWQASSNLHTALARASEDYQTAVNRCTQ